MLTAMRFLKLLSISVWIGGVVFLAFVLAPFAFTRLPSAHVAGLVVGGTLNILHIIGMVCGAIFLAACLGIYVDAKYRKPRIAAEVALVGAMLAVTAYSQFSVIARMESDRRQVVARVGAADADINAASVSDPNRIDFNRLHHLSENLEGVVLFAGIAVVWLLSRRDEAA